MIGNNDRLRLFKRLTSVAAPDLSGGQCSPFISHSRWVEEGLFFAHYNYLRSYSTLNNHIKSVVYRYLANAFLHTVSLTHLSLASLLWDIGKQHSPRCDAAERGVPSGAILFA